MPIQFIFITILTLFFFSTSSVIAREALLENSIDPFSFTFFRLFFGALTLILLVLFRERSLNLSLKKNWGSASMLFAYAIFFSLAYINLDAGLGALILFAVVQLGLISYAIFNKEHLTLHQLVGIALAFIGLCYLLLPQESFVISASHAFLMGISGLAWAGYTLLGKNSRDALHHTADNFIKAMLLGFILFLFIEETKIESYGLFLAFLSGGITSSLGYVLWYNILPKLQTSTAGVLQLLVPPIAIFLGVLFLDEPLTLTLMISTAVILLGIYLALKKPSR